MADELWDFPDIEDELKTVLREGTIALPGLGVRAATGVPDPRPATFVQAERTGGVRRTRKSDRPTVTITAWAPTRSEARQLLRRARTLLLSLRREHLPISGATVYAVAELGGPHNDPDPVSGSPRQSLVLSLHVGGSAPAGS